MLPQAKMSLKTRITLAEQSRSWYGRTVSQTRRGKTTRGKGAGSELICFIYDLPEPRWQYQPLQYSLLAGMEE